MNLPCQSPRQNSTLAGGRASHGASRIESSTVGVTDRQTIMYYVHIKQAAEPNDIISSSTYGIEGEAGHVGAATRNQRVRGGTGAFE